jgi:hypothetical protein
VPHHSARIQLCPEALHDPRHVLQPRLREVVGDVDWYWLLPQFVHAAHARLEPLPLAHEEVWFVAPLHAERHVLQPATTPASPSGMAAPPSSRGAGHAESGEACHHRQ